MSSEIQESAINDSLKHNFRMLIKAAINEDLALIKCTCATTGEPVFTICALNHGDEGYEAVPIARLFVGNPFEQLIPPV